MSWKMEDVSHEHERRLQNTDHYSNVKGEKKGVQRAKPRQE